MQETNPLYIIRDILADLYHRDADARRVAADAGLVARHIDFHGSAIDFWHAILREALQTGRLDALLTIIRKEYPAKSQLDEAWQQYLQSPQQYWLESEADKRVRDAYINPQSVIDRVNLQHYTGRKWLLAEVDAFLAEHDRGYFILEASAGLGKTAFLAWLVQQREYIHHFCELTPGLEGVGAALRSLAAQLVMKYHLQPNGVLNGIDTRPDYLYELLTKVSAQCADNEEIVLVIDALDEAGTPLNQNVLGLPRVLPKGVYLIVSHRSVPVTLRVETPRPIRYQLEATNDANIDDMRLFLELAAKWPEVECALQWNSCKITQFTSILLNKSRGLWIYLHYIVQDLKSHAQFGLNLESLPEGLNEYYSEYWRRWRNEDENAWDSCYLPLLATLAVAQQMLSRSQLIEWSDVNISPAKLRRLLEEKWQSFLFVDESGSYRFYHRSLNEFFTLGTNIQDTFSKELLEATNDAHYRVSSYYLQQWGGLEQGLPLLTQSASELSSEQQYALQHVVHHLFSGNKLDLLCQLVEHAQWQNAKPLLSVYSPSYIADLQQACRAALAISGYSSHIKAARFLWQQALARQALSPSTDVVIFLAELGYWGWACDLASMADDLWEQEKIWCGIARRMADRCPDKAIAALEHLVSYTENEEIGWQCRYLCIAAQLAAELNLDSNKGREFLNDALMKSRHLSEDVQKTFDQNWFLPTSAVLGGLDEAYESCEKSSSTENINGLCKILQAFKKLNDTHLPLVQKLVKLTSQQNDENIYEPKIYGLAAWAELQDGEARQYTLTQLELHMASVADSQIDSARLLMKTVQRVASYDIEWACKILNRNQWNHWHIDDAWPYVIEEMIEVDVDKALQLTDEKLENWLAYGHVLTQIIGKIAQQDLEKAEQLLATKQEKLSFNYAAAQVAIARVYMQRGAQLKAEKILFQREVFFGPQIDSTPGKPTWLERNQLELQISILHVASHVLPTEFLVSWYEELEEEMVKWHDMEQERKQSRRILIEALGYQGDLAPLRPYLRSQDDYELAALSLAKSKSVSASQCIEEFDISVDTEYGAAAHAYIALNLSDNTAKIDEFFEYYRDKHNFCYAMFHLPFILTELARTDKIDQDVLEDKLKFIWQVGINMLCPSHFDSERKFVFEQRRSKAMGQTIVAMSYLNLEWSEKMLAQAKDTTVAIYAFIELASCRPVNLEFISEFKQQACAAIEDNYERAAAYYRMTLQLSDEQGDSAKGLIEEAEPWLHQKPSHKHMASFGNHPVRYEISESDLYLLKAQALTRFLQENFEETAINELVELVDSAKTQDHKRRILLGLFAHAENWEFPYRHRLFSHMMEKFSGSQMRDVSPLIAACIPIIYKDGGIQSVKQLWQEVKSAFDSVSDWMKAKTLD